MDEAPTQCPRCGSPNVWYKDTPLDPVSRQPLRFTRAGAIWLGIIVGLGVYALGYMVIALTSAGDTLKLTLNLLAILVGAVVGLLTGMWRWNLQKAWLSQALHVKEIECRKCGNRWPAQPTAQ